MKLNFKKAPGEEKFKYERDAKNHEEAQKWYKLAYEKGCNKALTTYLSYFPKTKVFLLP